MIKNFVPLSFFVLISCVTHPYPAAWEKIDIKSKVGECPSIAGVYFEDNDGESVVGLTHFVFSHHLFSHDAPNYSFIPNAQKVEISQPSDEKLEIKVWAGPELFGELLYEKVLLKQKGDYTCEQDGLKIKLADTAIEPGALGFGMGSEQRIFNRSVEGNLLMNKTEKAGGIIFIFIPAIYSEGGQWYRWKQISE